MVKTSNRMKKLLSVSSPSKTAPLTYHLVNRLQVLRGPSDRGYLVRLAWGVESVEELIQRYSNDSML